MEPTVTEAGLIVNLSTLADWCELSNTKPSADALSPREALFAMLGVAGTGHYRAVANISAGDWMALLASWKYLGIAPPPAVLSQAGLLGRTARILCKVEKSQVDIDADLKYDRELALAQASKQVHASAGTAVAATVSHKLKLSQVVDQTNDDEIAILADSDLQVCYKRHVDRMQGPPDPGAECTGEQLTGIKHLLDSHRPPYVDFGIFGPHGYRIRRKIKLAGLVLGPGGVLQSVEIVGPPTVADWLKCYLVLRTALIMLDQVGLATLDRYSTQLNEYANRYGPVVWHIIYQADVRARLEHMERVRRIAIDEHAKAVAAGFSHSFEPDRPWDYVWTKMVDDANFWRKELEEPCVLVLAKTTSMSSMIGGDAPAATHNTNRPQSQGSVNYAVPQRTGGTGDYGGGASPLKKRKEHQHNTGSNGGMATNRSGTALCADFNAACGCGPTASTQHGARCPKDSSKAHQCSKCLSPGHGASSCNGQAAKVPSGKGKGNKGGKGKGGKGRNQY